MTNYYVRETPDGADVLNRISVNFSALICTCYEVSTAHQIVNALKALQAPPAAAVSVRDESPVYVCEGLTVPAWTVQYANELGAYFKAQNSGFWAIGPIQSRYGEPQQPAAAVPDMATIRGAVARGWCHKATEDREMDVTLAECIAIEVRAMLAANKENNNG